MSSLEFLLFSVLMVLVFLSMVLFVLFGQITVRRLRKIPEIIGGLGVEYIGGWDIVNVAQALALPRSWMAKPNDSPLAVLYANAELLCRHTNRFDRILANIFYWMLMSAFVLCVILVLFNVFGLWAE